jgi:hypothetical protein
MAGNSDHVMLGKAFLLWKECNSAAEQKRYCNRVGLAFNTMREILALTRQMDSLLTTLGFQRTTVCNKNDSLWQIVCLVLVAALSPTQVVCVQCPLAKLTKVKYYQSAMSSMHHSYYFLRHQYLLPSNCACVDS